MPKRLQDADGRWVTLLLAAPDEEGGERATGTLLRRLEPAARRLSRAAGLAAHFFYLRFGPRASVQLVLAAPGVAPAGRERLARALSRCAERWERRGWAESALYGFMDIERGLSGFGGPAGLAAVEAMEHAASDAACGAFRAAGTLLRMPGRTAFALCLADAVLDAALRSSELKRESARAWKTSYRALLRRDGFPVDELPAPRASTSAGELRGALEPWQARLLEEFAARLRGPGAALGRELGSPERFPLLSDVLWRRVIHQSWGRLGLGPLEEAVLLDWALSLHDPA